MSSARTFTVVRGPLLRIVVCEVYSFVIVGQVVYEIGDVDGHEWLDGFADLHVEPLRAHSKWATAHSLALGLAGYIVHTLPCHIIMTLNLNFSLQWRVSFVVYGRAQGRATEDVREYRARKVFWNPLSFQVAIRGCRYHKYLNDVMMRQNPDQTLTARWVSFNRGII